MSTQEPETSDSTSVSAQSSQGSQERLRKYNHDPKAGHRRVAGAG